MRDIWPSREATKAAVATALKPEHFTDVYGAISKGTDVWNSLNVKESKTY